MITIVLTFLIFTNTYIVFADAVTSVSADVPSSVTQNRGSYSISYFRGLPYVIPDKLLQVDNISPDLEQLASLLENATKNNPTILPVVNDDKKSINSFVILVDQPVVSSVLNSSKSPRVPIIVGVSLLVVLAFKLFLQKVGITLIKFLSHLFKL